MTERRPPEPGTARNVLIAIHVLSSRITRAFETRLETEHGVSVPEWRVLLSLSAGDGLTAKDVREHWALDKMTVSRAVAKLHRAGRLRRRRHPEDGRSFLLALTPRGRRVVERILPDADRRYRDILAVLDAEEQLRLKDVLARLLERTEAMSRREE